MNPALPSHSPIESCSVECWLFCLHSRFFKKKSLKPSVNPALPSHSPIESCSVTSAANSAGGEDEPGAPRRTTVRVMLEVCTWLLELGLPLTARQALSVAYESERVAVKKAQVNVLALRGRHYSCMLGETFMTFTETRQLSFRA